LEGRRKLSIAEQAVLDTIGLLGEDAKSVIRRVRSADYLMATLVDRFKIAADADSSTVVWLD
jgi:hypothetical protein